ncbi:MAG: Holliday junction branch migration protein RuvA [Alphaproteobacteria bacterium]
MIAKLKGIIDSIGDDFVVIDVGGVGYLVFASAKTLSQLPSKGGAASLFIETHVREDHIHLYGFAKEEEKKWFLILTKVQGVGAKVAMAILSVMTPDKIAEAIIAADKNAISKADGVGAKIALRIITELKDKPEVAASASYVMPQAPAGQTSSAKSSVFDDAVSALVNLGYQRSEAYIYVSKVLSESKEDIKVSALIKLALKEIGNKE